MKIGPHSLRYQLLLRSLAIVTCLLLIIGFLQYVFMGQFLYNRTAMAIQSEIRSIPDPWRLVQPQPPISAIEQGDLRDHSAQHLLSSLKKAGTTITYIDAMLHRHVVYANSSSTPVVPLLSSFYHRLLRQGNNGFSYQIVSGTHGHNLLVVSQVVGDQRSALGIIQVMTQTDALQDELFRQSLIFLGLVVFALLLGIAAFLPIIRKTLVPLSNLVETTRRINAGNLDERFTSKGAQSEIDLLADSFNAMLDRLHRAFQTERHTNEKMRQFVADASHELRTPLTSIHGYLEVLLRGAKNNPDQLERSLRSMYGESARMAKLVNDLIFLARMDQAPAPAFHIQSGSLDDLIREMEPQLRMLATTRHLSVHVDSHLQADFDHDKMKQVILNLVQNAVQHTDAVTGKIRISGIREGNRIHVAVQDNGEGINEENLPFIFERFYRADPARSHKHGGAGLGLSIIKSILDYHQATIRCDSKIGEGTIFHLWIQAS